MRGWRGEFSIVLPRLPLSELIPAPPPGPHQRRRTFLGRVDGGHGAEGPLAAVVVGPHLHLEGGEGRDGVVAEGVARDAGRGDGGPRPGDAAQRAEGDDVAEALAVLQLLGHRLRAKHKTAVILKRIQTKTQAGQSRGGVGVCVCVVLVLLRKPSHSHPARLLNIATLDGPEE